MIFTLGKKSDYTVSGIRVSPAYGRYMAIRKIYDLQFKHEFRNLK